MSTRVTWRDILQIGDERLRRVARPVVDINDQAVQADAAIVHGALLSFREEHGRGRGTAAPQLGIDRRLVALNMPGWPEIVYNPVITWHSADTMTVWEGCMSFPFLLARTERSTSISVSFVNPDGQDETREILDAFTSELLQHEFDHLDGVLAVDRAVDKGALMSRELFNRDKDKYLALVDYDGNHRY